MKTGMCTGLRAGAALALALGAAGPAEAQTLVDLGNVEASGLNDSGSVIGTIASTHVAFHEDATGRHQLLPAGARYSHAQKINAAGAVIGSYEAWVAQSDGSVKQQPGGFLFDGAGLHDLGIDMVPVDINDSGTIAGIDVGPNLVFVIDSMGLHHTGLRMNGWYSLSVNDSGAVCGSAALPSPNNHLIHAFLWDANGHHDLGTLDGYGSSFAMAINNAGVIAGCSQTTLDYGRPLYHLFVYDAGGMRRIETTVRDGLGIFPSAINDSGMIMGHFQPTDAAYGDLSHAFLHDATGFHDLGTLGGNRTEARAMNDSGAIVGRSQLASGIWHAFLYDGAGMHDLTPGWSGESDAVGINALGVIALNTSSGTVSSRRAYLRKLDQSISFPPLADRTAGDAPFALAATASTGLPVTFRVLAGPATISGGTITLTGAGTVVVEASQPGNGNYAPATPVTRWFDVAPAGSQGEPATSIPFAELTYTYPLDGYAGAQPGFQGDETGRELSDGVTSVGRFVGWQSNGEMVSFAPPWDGPYGDPFSWEDGFPLPTPRVEFSLGAPRDLSSISVNYLLRYQWGGPYRLEVSVSADGANYTKAATYFSSSFAGASSWGSNERFGVAANLPLQASGVRYVRLDFFSWDPGWGIELGEITFFGTNTPMEQVAIDIHPGSVPNSINLGSKGGVPVAILGSAAFDATTVDPLSLTLANAPVRLKANGTAMASHSDVNKDGFLDQVISIDTEALELSLEDVRADLYGKTTAGEWIHGHDSVRVVPEAK